MRTTFLVGADRSGTTLLASLLGTHPDVYVALEAQFLISEIRRLCRSGPTGTIRVDATSIGRIEDDVRFQQWGVAFSQSTKSLASAGASVEEFMASYIADCTTASGGPAPAMWVDHTPSNVRRAATLARAFEDARFVHIVRDGRAVAASLMQMDWGATDVGGAARFWVERVGQGLAAEAALGAAVVHRVHFERLVAEPQQVLEELKAFLELDQAGFDLTSHRGVPHSSSRGEHALVDQPPDVSRSTAWRNDLSARQIEVFEAIACDMLELCGYQPDFGAGATTPTRSERLVSKLNGEVFPLFNKLRFRRRMRTAARATADAHETDTRHPTPLRVIYNAASCKVGGGMSYAREQVSSLAERDDIDLTVVTSPPNVVVFEGIASVETIKCNLTSVPLRFLWEQTRLAVIARRFDVLVSPGNFATLAARRQVLILQNPNYVGAGRRLASNRTVRRRMKIAMSHISMLRSSAVVAISTSLQDQLKADRRLKKVESVVIRSGAPTMAQPSEDRAVRLGELGVTEPFVVSVANDYPHKKLGEIAEAWSRIEQPAAMLVYAGDIAATRREMIRTLAADNATKIVFLGAVGDQATIAALYSAANVAVSSSRLEAFPLTPHEAGRFGCPLVLTSIAPHREVAGDHANYYRPGDIEHLALLMEQSVHEPRVDAAWFWEYRWSEHTEALVSVLRETADHATI